jgi:hypothetical protein
MHYNQLFEPNSTELAKFLEKNKVGSTLQGPSGGKVWTISDVDIDEDIPPNPMTGKKSVKVSLTLTS